MELLELIRIFSTGLLESLVKELLESLVWQLIRISCNRTIRIFSMET
jgi:hypothetical protein